MNDVPVEFFIDERVETLIYVFLNAQFIFVFIFTFTTVHPYLLSNSLFY